MDSIKKPQEDNDWDLCIERSDASATLAEATGHKSDVEGQGPDASGETENAEKHNEKQQDATQAAESKVAPNLEGTDIGPNVVTAQSGVTSEKPEKIDLPYTRKRKSMTSKTKATWNTRTLELTCKPTLPQQHLKLLWTTNCWQQYPPSASSSRVFFSVASPSRKKI